MQFKLKKPPQVVYYYTHDRDSEDDCRRVSLDYSYTRSGPFHQGPGCALDVETCLRELRVQLGLAPDALLVPVAEPWTVG